jgi:uncharacterized protein
VNPFVIVNNPLPCKTCTAECCSSIPFFRKEFERAVEWLRMKSDKELMRLAKQQRPLNQCIFTDMSDYTCSIHEVRPTLCRIFGFHPKGVCSHAPEVATWKQSKADDMMMGAHLASNGEIVGISGPLTLDEDVREISQGVSFDWGDVLKAIDPNCEVTRTQREVKNVTITAEAPGKSVRSHD